MSKNPDLGEIVCEGCSGKAKIRRQANGRKLLYLHCANCGMDKRSGAKLQQKWQNAIGECQVADNNDLPDWEPEKKAVEEVEVEAEQNSKSSIGKVIAGGAIFLCAIFGIVRAG